MVPAYLPACMSDCVPAWSPTYLLAWLLACLPDKVPACLVTCMPTSSPACLPLRKQHHRPGTSASQDAHDDEEEGVGAAPLVDAEGVECLAVGVAPHAVLVDALAHVPGHDVVVVPFPILDLVLEVTAYEGHFPLEVLFVVLRK